MDDLYIPFSYAFVRALGLVAFLPFEVFAIGFGLRFLLALLLAISTLNQAFIPSELNILSYLLSFLVGFVIVFPVVLIIQAADLWGDLYESLRGQTAGSIADPLFQGETSHLALLSKGLIWIGLISVGVLEGLYVQYLKSFAVTGLEISLWQKSIVIFSNVMSTSMQLAIPFAMLFLVIEISALFAAKLLPGVSMIAETFTAKMLLGGIGLISILGLEPLSSLKIILERLTLV